MSPGPFPIRVTIPMTYDNKASSRNLGGEISVDWAVTSRWRLRNGYSVLRQRARFDPASRDVYTADMFAAVPGQSFQIRSSWDLTRTIEFDQTLAWTGRLQGGNVPGYIRLDARLARRLGESTELALVGQNLLRPATRQFPDVGGVVGTMAQRSVYGKITWMF
jgi:iron complex outermembrane receptor protein